MAAQGSDVLFNSSFERSEKIKLSICAAKYIFVRKGQSDVILLSEGYISFVSSQGFFAALGHNECNTSTPYTNAELYAQDKISDEPIQAGRVLLSHPTGVYGAFYDDYKPPVFSQMAVAAPSELSIGAPAELWMSVGAGEPQVFKGRIVALFPGKPHPVLFEVTDNRFPGASFGSSGSVVVQSGKIAAVVAGANKNPARLLYCTAAEQMLIDLKDMIRKLAASEDIC